MEVAWQAHFVTNMFIRPTKEELEQRRWVIEQKQLNKKLDGGLKKFYYQGEVIYARNKKNADRKAKNKGLL